LIICLFSIKSLYANNSQKCDSIIKKGVELMLKKKHVKSLELLSEARSMAEKNKWYQQLFLAQNNIGNNYYMLLDYGEALKQYLISYQIAIKHLDAKHEMIVLNNIAILYSKEEKFDKAKEHFQKAYTIAVSEKDSLKMGLYSMNLGTLSNAENQPKKAISYLNRGLKYTNNNLVKIPALVSLCNSDVLLGNYQKARQRAISLLPELKDDENNDNRVGTMTIIAKSYLKENNLAAALQWTNNAIAENPDLEKRVELCRHLSEIYFKLKSYELALNYKDSVNVYENKLNTIKNGKLYESSEVKFQIQNFKRQILQNEAVIKSERNFFYSVLVAVVLGIIVLILIFRDKLLKNKQKSELMLRENEITMFKLEKERAEKELLLEKERTAILEKEQLQSEIEIRNQKIFSGALLQSEKNKLLHQIIKSLSELAQVTESNSIYSQIKALKAHIKEDDDWESYFRHFDDVNQGFIKKLVEKHPQLTTSDIRYISYVYMNLDNKEIANILHITPEACRKRKERVEKKLILPNDISLRTYLLSI
jgi:tetratricopeptide (TPR) repeat protein